MHQTINLIALRQQTPFHHTEPQLVQALRHQGTPDRSPCVEEWRIPTLPRDNLPRFDLVAVDLDAGVSDDELEIIHDDLVCYMPVVSVSRRKYGFVVMEEYSPASWGLSLRAKSDAPTELEIWAKDGERNGESCLTTRIVEPVEGRNREYCGHKESRGNTPVPHSPSSNGNLLA